ncbi:MAG: class I SAM-dependent methyltransferase [Proteobacteria bacterium]|nr:class I SAM-dependent methyltransferase [Pseudomonadota bacterium]
MSRLSARLEAVVQLVSPCRTLADVGTDHGLVPIAVVLRGVATHAIAADLREAPLAVARRNLARARVGKRVTIVQGDGLIALRGRAVEAVTMAGISGQLMVRLLEAAPDVLAGLTQLVLQPNSEPAVVRAWARGHGWHLRDERMVEGDGRFFVVCAFVPGVGEDPAYAVAGWTDAALARIGPWLLARRDPIAARWCRAQHDRVRALVVDGAPGLAAELATWQAACALLA